MAFNPFAIRSGRSGQIIETSLDFDAIRAKCAMYNDTEASQPDLGAGPWRGLYVLEPVKHPKLTVEEFDALCVKVRATRGGRRVLGARLVLVEGERISAAAAAVGVSHTNISHLIKLLLTEYFGLAPSK